MKITIKFEDLSETQARAVVIAVGRMPDRSFKVMGKQTLSYDFMSVIEAGIALGKVEMDNVEKM